ncbi:MAG TPA: YceI family protein [Micromonosporaceae bacterium]|nr:YceI family protein [Micromonosporaceae bacterium]
MTTIDTGTWTVDTTQTTASFTARGLTGAVRGTIPVTAATIEVGNAGRPARLRATLDPAAIDTGNARRDKDLRSGRFLKVDDHPAMEVAADRFEQTGHGWCTDATLRVAGHSTRLHIEGGLEEAAGAARMRLTGTARLDIRTVGIRVPGFMVRRYVEIAVTAELTRPGGR